MNKEKSPIIKILVCCTVVIAFISDIFGCYTALKDILINKFYWLPVELHNNFSILLLIIIIIVILALFFYLIQRTKKNKFNINQKEEKIRQVYLKWLGKDLKNRIKSNLHTASFILLSKNEELNKVYSSVFQDYNFTENEKEVKSNFIEDYLRRDEKRILLLGAPGSGKTTTILKLLEIFHHEAIINKNCEIPIYLNLSSWGYVSNINTVSSRNIFKRQRITNITPNIKDWIINELINNHALFKNSKIIDEWLKCKKLIFLLDGLDEANESLRCKLFVKLNEFIKEYTQFDTKLIICSRIADYEALVESTSTKLLLDAAVSLQPFSNIQIDEYLESTNSFIVKKLIREDEDLKRMASNPLMLSVMVLAYCNLNNPPEISYKTLSYTFKKLHLFSTFVNSMIKRKILRDNSNGNISEIMYKYNDEYIPKKINNKICVKTDMTRKYLSWLSINLSAVSRTTFSYRNIYNLLLNSDMASGLIRSVHVLFASILSIIFVIIIIPHLLITNDIFTYTFNKVTSSISLLIITGSIISFLILKLDNKDTDKDKDNNKINLRFVIENMFVWTVCILLTSYFFSGINIIFPKCHIGTIIAITAIITLNAKYILDKLNNKNKIDRKEFIFLNLILISVNYIGIFIFDKPTVFISMFISILSLYAPIFIVDKSRNYILHICIIFSCGCILFCFNPILTAVGTIIPLIVVLIWENIGIKLHMKYFEENLIRFILKISGKIPFRFGEFIKFCNDALLIHKVHNGFEFNHRYIKDYFSIQHILQLNETYSIEKRKEIIKDLVKMKDASCDVLLDLIEDEDKQVRLACIEGLGLIGTTQAAQILIRTIKTTEDGLCNAAINSLKFIKDYSSIPILYKFAKSNPYGSKSYYAAIYALANINGLDILNNASELEFIIKDENITNDNVKYEAFSSLIKLAPEIAITDSVQNRILLNSNFNFHTNKIIVKHTNPNKYLEILINEDMLDYYWKENIKLQKIIKLPYFSLLRTYKKMGLYIDINNIKLFIDEKSSLTTRRALIIMIFFYKRKSILEFEKLINCNNDEICQFIEELIIKEYSIFEFYCTRIVLKLYFLKIKKYISNKLTLSFKLISVKYANIIQNEKSKGIYLKNINTKNSTIKNICANSIIRYNLRSAIPYLIEILKKEPFNPEIIRIFVKFQLLNLLDVNIILNNEKFIPQVDFIYYLVKKETNELIQYFEDIIYVYKYTDIQCLSLKEVFVIKMDTEEVINKIKNEIKRNYRDRTVELLIAFGKKENIPFIINIIVEHKYMFYENKLPSFFDSNISFASVLDNFNNEDEYLYLASAFYLAKKWPQESVLPLHKLLMHTSSGVRYSAAFGLGEIGNTNSLLPLKALLVDTEYVSVTLNEKHTRVNDAVLEAIKKIGTLESKKIIENFMQLTVNLTTG